MHLLEASLTQMKNYPTPKPLLLLFTLAVVFSCNNASAQVFSTLHSFTALINNTNSDGADPLANLTLSGNTLYGTAFEGGSSGFGTVFAVNTDGKGFTNLYNFASEGFLPYTNSGGAYPEAGLILSGNILYGTAGGGGTNASGTVFAINTNGACFTTLSDFSPVSINYADNSYFTNIDGASPNALILSGNILYGTAEEGGTNGNGTVFAINTNGAGFTILHTFTGIFPDNDGNNPFAGLILSGNTLYGTALDGGTNNCGTVFALNTNGTGFVTLHNFGQRNYNSSIGSYTNSDGASPNALILSSNILYGTTRSAGNSGNGTVFALNTNGMGFTILYSFTANSVNSDGANPSAGLILSGNTLYGTAIYGGSGGEGTVFAINTDGTGFTNLHSFTATGLTGTNSDGANPFGGLILSGNSLYGTARNGGVVGNGTVFSLVLPQVVTPPVIPPTLTLQFWSGYPLLSLYGTLGDTYTVEYTANLAVPNWMPMLIVPNLSVSPFQMIDSAGVGQSARFYRAVQSQ